MSRCFRKIEKGARDACQAKIEAWKNQGSNLPQFIRKEQYCAYKGGWQNRTPAMTGNIQVSTKQCLVRMMLWI